MGDWIITVDGGTTNTRAFLWDSRGRLAGSARSGVGVRDCARAGSNEVLKEAVKRLLEGLPGSCGLSWGDISGVWASGMITSEVGLYELPHLTAPAGPGEFAAGTRTVLLPEVCPLPVRFIPGLKNRTGPTSPGMPGEMDFMRGEETEALALLELGRISGPCVLVLPGSHTKFVFAQEGRLCGCLTTMAGELLETLTKDTILAEAVGGTFAPEDYDREMLLEGSRRSRESGLGRAAFFTRIRARLTECSREQLASYLLGAVLGQDALALTGCGALRPDAEILVCGKEPLQGALRDILRDCGLRADIFAREGQEPLSGLGALAVARLYRDGRSPN